MDYSIPDSNKNQYPLVGVSACLLGHRVRYDAKRLEKTDFLSKFDEFAVWYPVCPEVEMGLPVPREPIQILANNLQLISIQKKANLTQRMKDFIKRKQQLPIFSVLDGYITKNRSPSCGLNDTPLHDDTGNPVLTSSGLFTSALIKKFPSLPIINIESLSEKECQAHFLTQLYAHLRWRFLFYNHASINKLMYFHAYHKYLLLSHNEALYRKLGQLVAISKNNNFNEILSRYGLLFMEALTHKPSISSLINVFQHILGFFKHDLNSDIKSLIHRKINNFDGSEKEKQEILNDLFNLSNSQDIKWLKNQLIFSPYPIRILEQI